MFGTRLLFIVFTSLVRLLLAGQNRCDKSTDAMVHDGNIGESGVFNWLGILRVHLHDGDNTKIALTGVVLIKENYVLANADDISRIPMNVFKQESQIMFIPQNATPWYCRPLSYNTHPEYEYSTYNTISLIELDLDDIETYPLKPICWPKKMINASNHLYVTGYTDDNKFLEKIVYKLKFVEKTTCEQFYKKAGLSSESRTPLYYQCGFAEKDRENCVWDNGMALITNATGWFSLIGLGVRGPGCAAPSRYIDIYQYLQWLDLMTSDNEIDDYADYRRAQKKDPVEYVPAHELLRSDSEKFKGFHFNKYAFDVESMRYFNIEQTEPNAFNISPFNDTYENENGSCANVDQNTNLVYREHYKIQTDPEARGHVSYKLTLYDFAVVNLTCVKLIVECLNRSEATLYYMEIMDFAEGTAIADSGETPDDIFKYYYRKDRRQKNKTDPDPYLRPEFLKADWPARLNISNVNLVLKFEFEGEAIVKFEMYGEHLKPRTAVPGGKRRKLNFRSRNKDYFEDIIGNAKEPNTEVPLALGSATEGVVDPKNISGGTFTKFSIEVSFVILIIIFICY